MARKSQLPMLYCGWKQILREHQILYFGFFQLSSKFLRSKILKKKHLFNKKIQILRDCHPNSKGKWAKTHILLKTIFDWYFWLHSSFMNPSFMAGDRDIKRQPRIVDSQRKRFKIKEHQRKCKIESIRPKNSITTTGRSTTRRKNHGKAFSDEKTKIGKPSHYKPSVSTDCHLRLLPCQGHEKIHRNGWITRKHLERPWTEIQRHHKQK